MVLSAKDLLQDLVRLPSVNPAFSGPEEPAAGEFRITDFFQNFFQNRGWPWLRQPVHAGRDNLICVILPSKATNNRQAVLWEVHQDTVGVAGMKIEPFAASESQGRIWGRGACDVKGAMAAMVTALANLDPQLLARPVVFALTINEENGFTGVKSLCRIWSEPQESQMEGLSGSLSLEQLRELRPFRAIVAEPTLMDVVVAHKGSVRWRCHTRGRAAHSSRPEQGVNAISIMTQVIRAIEKYQREVLAQRASHPLCGPPTICVSTIRGGTGVNTVPDHCVIDIDRRLVPEATADQAYEELVRFVGDELPDLAKHVEHDPPASRSVGLEDKQNRPWAEQIAATVQATGNPSKLIGVPYGTDAWAISQLGIPTVVFGPGSIDQAHTDDEWIAIDQLELAVDVFSRLAMAQE